MWHVLQGPQQSTNVKTNTHKDIPCRPTAYTNYNNKLRPLLRDELNHMYGFKNTCTIHNKLLNWPKIHQSNFKINLTSYIFHSGNSKSLLGQPTLKRVIPPSKIRFCNVLTSRSTFTIIYFTIMIKIMKITLLLKYNIDIFHIAYPIYNIF